MAQIKDLPYSIFIAKVDQSLMKSGSSKQDARNYY
jgi:hypothetical protein